MPFIERDGVKIFYEDAGRGVPVLLTHGYGASGEMWRPQLEALSDRYRLITWDMRGHGRTDSPSDPAQYSADLTVEDIRALLARCGVNRAVIGGLSLGGFMSLAFHATYREVVMALVLADTGPGYRNAAAREQWNEMARGMATAFETRGLAALRDSPEVKAATHRSAQGLAHAARHMLTQSDDRVITSLPDIKVPALVVVGDRDERFIAPCRYMAAKIPGAELAVVNDAGHGANLDQPAQFNDVLATFLDRLPR